MSIQKSRILSEAEINVLFVKANRFLSKDSVKKEKSKIKAEVKAGFITGSGSKQGKIYIRDGQVVESSGNEDSENDKDNSKL